MLQTLSEVFATSMQDFMYIIAISGAFDENTHTGNFISNHPKRYDEKLYCNPYHSVFHDFYTIYRYL